MFMCDYCLCIYFYNYYCSLGYILNTTVDSHGFHPSYSYSYMIPRRLINNYYFLLVIGEKIYTVPFYGSTSLCYMHF